MKKRRTLIVALLLIATLALGIGYAAVDGSLVIDGKVQTVKQPFNVHFSAFTQGASSAKVTGNVPAVTCENQFPSKSIMLNVSGMASEGDYVEAIVSIKNENDCTMYVNVPTIKYGTTVDNVTANDSENFTVTTDWTGAKEIPVDGTVDIKVTITMRKSCTDATYQEYFRLTLTGTPTNPNP